MKRRDLLMLAACEANVPPVDMDKLNRFAQAYNRYIERLKTDVLDLKAWKDVLDAWQKLH